MKWGGAQEDDGLITKIAERRNQFIRPPIANVDCFAVVMAAARPKPNLSIVDRFLVMAERSGADIILCMNKIDLADEEQVSAIRSVYQPLYPVVCLCGSTGQGIETLKDQLKGKRTGPGRTIRCGKIDDFKSPQTGCGCRNRRCEPKDEAGKTYHPPLRAL